MSLLIKGARTPEVQVAPRSRLHLIDHFWGARNSYSTVLFARLFY